MALSCLYIDSCVFKQLCISVASWKVFLEGPRHYQVQPETSCRSSNVGFWRRSDFCSVLYLSCRTSFMICQEEYVYDTLE